MEAVDEAHGASEDLKRNTNHDICNAFQVKIDKLHGRLGQLKTVLENEEAYTMDELMDALSRLYSSHQADYRRMPRMK